MPYDEKALERLQEAVADLALEPSEDITEKKMFGGICLLLNGSILAGMSGDEFLIRLSEEDMEEALDRPHVRRMMMRERPVKHFAFVEPAGFADDALVGEWLRKGLTYVREWRRLDAAKTRTRRK